MKIQELIESYKLVCDENYNLVFLFDTIGQATITNVNIKKLFKMATQKILDDYKIGYTNKEISHFTDIMMTAYEKFDHHQENLSFVGLLVCNIDLNIKEEMYNLNYILSSTDNLSNFIAHSILFHQLDFNLKNITFNTLLNMRIFILAHYAAVFNKKIKIKTPVRTLNLISDIEIDKQNEKNYIFEPHNIRISD